MTILFHKFPCYILNSVIVEVLHNFKTSNIRGHKENLRFGNNDKLKELVTWTYPNNWKHY